MARKRKASDTARNARRRYVRQSQRYMNKASQAKGSLKSRFEQLAKDMLYKAVSLYKKVDTSKVEQPVKDIASKLGVDISQIQTTKDKLSAIAESYETLKNQDGTGARSVREREAQALLKNGNIANRLYAGLSEVLKDVPYNQREQAILDYFGAETMLDVFDELEKVVNLYDPSTASEKYDEVVTAIMNYEPKAQG